MSIPQPQWARRVTQNFTCTAGRQMGRNVPHHFDILFDIEEDETARTVLSSAKMRSVGESKGEAEDGPDYSPFKSQVDELYKVLVPFYDVTVGLYPVSQCLVFNRYHVERLVQSRAAILLS